VFENDQIQDVIDKYVHKPSETVDKEKEMKKGESSDNDKYQIDLRRKIKHFILTGKINETTALLEEHFPDLWISNKII
jgi:hypothetical protein